MNKAKEVFRSSFFQLTVIYTVFIALISFGAFQKYSLQFHFLAIILAVLGISILPGELEKEDKKGDMRNRRILNFILGVALALIVVLRAIPYQHNSVPLGYDAGLYKYGIEHGLENKDAWILQGGMEPGFLYLMEFFKVLLSTWSILTWLLIGFCLLLGVAIFIFTKEVGGPEAAVYSSVAYSFSVVQFRVFTMMYYKNIIGLSLMLFALFFLMRFDKTGRKSFLITFIALGGILLGVHRPTFYILGLSYFAYVIINLLKKGEKRIYDWQRLKTNVISGAMIIIVGLLFYIGDFMPAITRILPFVAGSLASPGESPGTFISFVEYQYSTLFYLPFALLGLFYFLKRKELGIVVLWSLINLAIVYFQFFFFNRFIIHLDIALIILAGVGFRILRREKRHYWILIGVIFLSGLFAIIIQAREAAPLISRENFELIEKIPKITEKDAKIISISSEYSPWIKGYSERVTIAPGMFDENKWNELQWEIFWNSKLKEASITLMQDYDGPIYLFAGSKDFNNPCFEIFIEDEGRIYKYAC